MKCLCADGKPCYCSAQGSIPNPAFEPSWRLSAALRQEGIALASTPAGDGNEAGATQTHGGPACVLTGCEHGSEKVSENWPDGRNACPCPCPCEVDPSTNQNLDDRVSPSPPPAILPASVRLLRDVGSDDEVEGRIAPTYDALGDLTGVTILSRVVRGADAEGKMFVRKVDGGCSDFLLQLLKVAPTLALTRTLTTHLSLSP